MVTNQRHWVIEDHLCSDCGGRILRCIKGNGASPGGNPAFKCADCGRETTSMGPNCLCWCGYSHRGNRATAYTCLRFSLIKKYPKLQEAFAACGTRPGNAEVGIVLEESWNKIVKEEQAKWAPKIVSKK